MDQLEVEVAPLKILREICEGREQKAVAQELGISAAYLNDVLQDRREPGPKILKALGLEKQVRYVRTNGRSRVRTKNSPPR